MNINKDYVFFSEHLLKWHRHYNKRIMPWTGEKNIYKIWISEIILQQTRVEQGKSYYLQFIKKFPTLKSLAQANINTVIKIWEGLGYYSRARNLHSTAKEIYYNLKGIFPDTYEGLIKFKGIGPYTAAAIASFAYDLPHAVVDGNVYRVLSRFFCERIPIDSPTGVKHFTLLANSLLSKDEPGAFNQAIMDFGATVCTPQVPKCNECILQIQCEAYKQGLVNILPINKKRLIKKKRYFTYFIFSCDKKLLVKERAEKDIWKNLFEFYLYESVNLPKWKGDEIQTWLSEQMGVSKYELLQVSKNYFQQLTHQTLEAKFIVIKLSSLPDSLQYFTAYNTTTIQKLSFPKLINQYLLDEFTKVKL